MLQQTLLATDQEIQKEQIVSQMVLQLQVVVMHRVKADRLNN
jgi:hypothetical protein